MKTAWRIIVINGILAWPGASDGWTDRAVTWFISNGLSWLTTLGSVVTCQKYEYWRGVFFRWLGRSWLVRDIAQMTASAYAGGDNVCIVGHSNGADLAVRAIREAHGAKGIVLHLIAGAFDPDFEENGLNDLIADGTVREVHIWRCGKDWALNFWAPLTRVATLWLAGFKSGGAIQEKWRYNLSSRDAVKFHDFPEMGHSDLLSDGELPRTLAKIGDWLSVFGNGGKDAA